MGIGVTGPEGSKQPEKPTHAIENFESVDTADEIRQLLEDAETIEAYIRVIDELCRFFEERYHFKNERQFIKDNTADVIPTYKPYEAFDQWWEKALYEIHNKALIALSLYAVVKDLESMQPESIQEELARTKQSLEEAEARGVSNLTINDTGIGTIRQDNFTIDEMIQEIKEEETAGEKYMLYGFTPKRVRKMVETQLQFHNDLIKPQIFPRFFADLEKKGKDEAIVRVYDLKHPDQTQTLTLNETVDYNNQEMRGRIKTFIREALRYFRSLSENPPREDQEQQTVKIDLVEGPSGLAELLSDPSIQNTSFTLNLEGTPDEIGHTITLFGHPQNLEFAQKIEGKRIQLTGSVSGIVLTSDHTREETAPLIETITDRYGNAIIIARDRATIAFDEVTHKPNAFKDIGTRVIIFCPTPYVDDPTEVTLQEFKIDLSGLHERGIIETEQEIVFNVLPSAPIEHDESIAIHTENPENYPKIRDKTHLLVDGAREAEAWFKTEGSIERIHVLMAENPNAHFMKVNKGTLYVKEPLLLTTVFDSRSTGRHEALHLIDEQLKISESPEFKAVYEKYKDLAGTVAEYHFEQSVGGHPQDNAGEYFASFINSLMCCDDPKESIQKFTRMDLGGSLDRPDIYMIKETAQVILKRIEEIKKGTKDSEPWLIENQLNALVKFIG